LGRLEEKVNSLYIGPVELEVPLRLS
jgi:hypothetical protein